MFGQQKSVTVVALGVLCLGLESGYAVEDGRFGNIERRNVFGLKPAPPPPDLAAVEPPKPATSVKLTGIISFGMLKAILQLSEQGKPGEAKILTVGDTEGPIEVKAIDAEAGTVTINNNGQELVLNFEKDGIKPTGGPAPGAPSAPPAPPPIPGAMSGAPNLPGAVPAGSSNPSMNPSGTVSRSGLSGTGTAGLPMGGMPVGSAGITGPGGMSLNFGQQPVANYVVPRSQEQTLSLEHQVLSTLIQQGELQNGGQSNPQQNGQPKTGGLPGKLGPIVFPPYPFSENGLLTPEQQQNNNR